MNGDAKADTKTLAAGAERAVPQPGEANPQRTDGKMGERNGSGRFRFAAVIVAGLALACSGCALDSSGLGQDSGAEEDGGPDAEIEQDADAVVEEGGETDVGEEDGEAEASCPTLGMVSENPAAPGTIDGIEQTITETYEIVTECDGSETRELVELEVALASPASREQMDAAVMNGTDTMLFGELVRFTYLGTDAVEYAAHVPGAEGTVRSMRNVSDGTYAGIVQDISETSVTVNVENDGTPVDSYTMAPGTYITLPGGRILMMTALNFDAADPLRSTCYLAILEAPARVSDGERVERLGHGFFFNAEGDGANLAGLDFIREYM
jgi:hypothetical protein